MKQKLLISAGCTVIGVVFAAWGGFLFDIAPPQADDNTFAVGFSSFLALLVLFAINAFATQKFPRGRIIAGVVLSGLLVVAGYYYWTTYTTLTFAYPPGNTKVDHVAGAELTPEAASYKQQHPGLSSAQLLAKFGGLENQYEVWPEASVNNARLKLVITYVGLVVALAGALFVLTDVIVNFASKVSGDGHPSPPPPSA